MATTKSADFVKTASVRRAFLDFFSQRGHALLPGSPVLPLGDSSVPFVPAGMHQFRHVLVGDSPAPAPQVANSQRCIRIGGRHCDLATVGTDGSHLTFFEMLGSWTFGASSYWKREACEDALKLLTGPLRIDASRLLVTYFEGDSQIEADKECYDVWRSLGIPDERIRSHPANDNLWEMGVKGPCGPCTEIHVDGVEIWNLVFVDRKRSLDGTLTALDVRSIDTGLGLERLTALLSGRSSVYDTDAFQPLLETIANVTRTHPYGGSFDNQPNTRDAAYRLLADHARTITVAIADGVTPDSHYKLRKIVRKCFWLSKRFFKGKDPLKTASLLEELALRTVENLNEGHPTLAAGLPAIQQILRHEATLFTNLHNKVPFEWKDAVAEEPRLAGLADSGIPRIIILHAWKSMKILSDNGFKTLTGIEAYRIYERHGLEVEVQDDLAKFCGMEGADVEGFSKEQARRRDLSRLKRSMVGVTNLENYADFAEILSKLPEDLPPTDTTSVYSYTRTDNGYVFPSVESEVLAVIQGDEVVDEALPGKGPVGVILTKTNMYRNLGGQHADHGKIETPSGAVLSVAEPIDVDDIVIHWGELEGSPLSVGDQVKVSIDENRRTSLMVNHTAVHLFNGCLREHLPAATQIRAPVLPEHSSLVLNSLGKELPIEIVESVEEKVRELVKSSLPVSRKIVTSWNWYTEGPVTLICGADYPPKDLSMVEIGGKFRELCGGTHVYNTADVGDVCVIKGDWKQGPELTFLTGGKATTAYENGKPLLKEAQTIADDVCAVRSGLNPERLVEEWKRCKAFVENRNDVVPRSYFLEQKSVKLVEDSMKALEERAKVLMQEEINEAANEHFAAVFVQSAQILEKVRLIRAIRPFLGKALLVVAVLRNGRVTGRCVVPDTLVTENFNARLWLAPLAEALKGRAVAALGFNAKAACTLDGVSFNPDPKTVQDLVEDARRFAENAVPKRVAAV